MVKYDSSRKHLLLQRSTTIEGMSAKTDPEVIDLSLLSEPVRQIVIQIAKQCVNYANGQPVNESIREFISKMSEKTMVSSLSESGKPDNDQTT